MTNRMHERKGCKLCNRNADTDEYSQVENKQTNKPTQDRKVIKNNVS